jgi:hypothetical protein
MNPSDPYDISYIPDAEGMINNMNYGGLDLFSCIQELKDNSDDAKASNINIYLLSKDKDTTALDQIIVTDDGPGMDAIMLRNSIILAKQNEHNSFDIGKFGMGLKNATMALSDSIAIITKTEDGTTRGLYMDLNQMKRDKTYKPTLISEDAEKFKALIARNELYDAFMKQKSGVFISMREIKMNIENSCVEAINLQSALNLGYKKHISCTKIYTSNDSDPLEVSEVDVFYRSNPENLTYEADTCIRVYMKPNKKTDEAVYEVLKGKRYKKNHKGKSTFWQGTPTKPLYLKHTKEHKGETKAGKPKYDLKTTEISSSQLPNGPFVDNPIRFISVNEDVYDAEGIDPKFSGVPNKRRGMWFYRGIRNVGKCIDLGTFLNDECNRQRMEISYDPDLDFPMGMRIQKQMGTINSTAINDALICIWSQQNNEVIRLKKKERKETKPQTSNEEDEDEDEDEYEQLAKHLSSEEEAPVIIKAKRSIVAPYPLSDTPNSQEETAVEETTVEETVAEETDVEETVVEETVVEETVVEETVVEETVVEETVVEETVVEETDVEEQEQVKEDLVEQKVVEQEEPVVTTNTVSNNLQPINIIIQPQLEPQANKNITSVGGYIRNTSKSQNDVILKLLSIIENPKIIQKLKELKENPSIITHSKWAQIYAQLEVLENELSN